MASTFRPHEVVLPRYLYARYSLPIPVDSSTAKIENKDELKNSISACQGPADSFVGDAEVGRAAGVEAPVPDGRCRGRQETCEKRQDSTAVQISDAVALYCRWNGLSFACWPSVFRPDTCCERGVNCEMGHRRSQGSLLFHGPAESPYHTSHAMKQPEPASAGRLSHFDMTGLCSPKVPITLDNKMM